MVETTTTENHKLDLRTVKVRVDFGELTLAEQAEVFDQLESLGIKADPENPSASQGVRFNAAVAWVLLLRDHPAITFDEVYHGIPGRNVEVAPAEPLAQAGNAG